MCVSLCVCFAVCAVPIYEERVPFLSCGVCAPFVVFLTAALQEWLGMVQQLFRRVRHYGISTHTLPSLAALCCAIECQCSHSLPVCVCEHISRRHTLQDLRADPVKVELAEPAYLQVTGLRWTHLVTTVHVV